MWNCEANLSTMKKKRSLQFLLINLIFFGFTEAGKICDFAEKFPCKGKHCYHPPEEDSPPEEKRPTTTELQTTTSLGSTVPVCPPNMVPAVNGSCSVTCQDPNNTTGCVNAHSTNSTCMCADSYYMNGTHCVKEEECGCYLLTVGIIEDGASFINTNCTSRYNCSNNRLTHDVNYRCSDNATCEERDGERRCYCDRGLAGDGITCRKASDCYELYNSGIHADGVYTIHPTGWEDSGFQVFCEMSPTDGGGGGWTVFQRRTSGTVNFYRGWTEYKNGFESPVGDHWLGNDKIHSLTSQKAYKLRVDLTNSAGSEYHALYKSFSINDESDNYRLSLGSCSGNAGNAMQRNNGLQFSTHDNDSDAWSNINCAEKHRGGWWYGLASFHTHNCFCWYNAFYYSCLDSNLNGYYNYNNYQGIFWYALPGSYCGILGTKMSIRPE